MAPGTLITIEGIDGAGKTTLAQGMRDALSARGSEAVLLREPGGVRDAERIRELVKDPEARIGARAEALLYAAARAQLVEEALRPLLDGGALILLDRFVDSSLAYQGAGRELGVAQIAAINTFATGALSPDRTLYLRLDPDLGSRRSRARTSVPDRLERSGDAFFHRVAGAYDALARADTARIRVIDATQSPERVLADALTEIADLL